MSDLPYIGWKACEQRFYLDALPISDAEALKHWKAGTARFGENAAKRLHEAKTVRVDRSDNYERN